MAKKSEKIEYDEELFNNNIILTELAEYVKERVVIYGTNVSVFRACATLYDGLTPVRRRILWNMYHDAGLTPYKRYTKVPEFLWNTAKYHPHGDQTITSTFNSMIKVFETNAPLIEVPGNTGSLTGDQGAAVRYLDARLSMYAYKCFFEEFDEDVVEMTRNYIDTDVEPIYLPSKYPNFLFHMVTGIGWGNSFDIIPFNLIEAFRLTQSLLTNPEMTNVFLYPDSPRGYDIINNGTIVETCKTGHGTVELRAKMIYNEETNCIEVSGFPEHIMMDPVMEEISKLVANKFLIGIEDLSDESGIEYTEFWIHLKKDTDPYYIITQLIKSTKLEYYAKIMFNFAGRTKMEPKGLKDALLDWIDWRIDMKQKICSKQLSKLKERKHALEALMKVLKQRKNFDKATDIIRKSVDDDDTLKLLAKDFDVTSYQANVISGIGLKQGNKDRIAKLEQEYSDIDHKIAKMEEIVRSKKKLIGVIYDELEEGIKLFGRPRRCKVLQPNEVKRHTSSFRIVVTRKCIKKLSLTGNRIGYVDPDDDVISYYSSVSDDDIIFLITKTGMVRMIPLENLPANDVVGKGSVIKDILGISEEIVCGARYSREQMKKVSKNPESILLVMFTTNGIVKATPISQYMKSKGNLQGIMLNTGDEVSFAFITDTTITEDPQRLIYTKKGMGIIMPMDGFSITDRMTKGTQYLKMETGDVVQGVVPSEGVDEVCIVTEKGYGKISELDDIFRTTKRRATMIKLSGLADGDRILRIIPVDDKFSEGKVAFHLQSGEKQEVPFTDIEKMTRFSKPQKLVRVKRGDAIVRIKFI